MDGQEKFYRDKRDAYQKRAYAQNSRDVRYNRTIDKLNKSEVQLNERLSMLEELEFMFTKVIPSIYGL